MKRLITLILAIALCVPLYIPVQAEFRYDLSEYSLLLNIKDVYPIQPGTEEWKKLETLQSKITSKWGEYGLYEHTIYDCPYAGNRTTYSYWSLA